MERIITDAPRKGIIIMENLINVDGETYELFSAAELASEDEPAAEPTAKKTRLIDGKEYSYSGLGSTKVHFRKRPDGRWETFGALPKGWPTWIESFNAIYQLRQVVDLCHLYNEFPATDLCQEPTLETFPSLLDRSTIWDG